MSGCLRKEMLTFEPLQLVQTKLPLKHEVELGLQILELSNLDHLYDYCNTIALFYDVDNGITHDYRLVESGARNRIVSNECTSTGSNNTGFNGFNEDDLGEPSSDPTNILRSALEELLIQYPAAAGRLHVNEITGRYEVMYKLESSCSTSRLMDDDNSSYGVPYMVAHCNSSLSVLGDVSAPHPSLDVLYPSVPLRNHKNHPPPPVVLMQVTTFTCGSFTLALMSNHMLTDAYAAAVFFKNLCSIARGAGLDTVMDMTNRREIMKPSVPLSPKAIGRPHICTRKRAEAHASPELPYGTATRFSFSAASLETLRSRVVLEKPCSRFQSLVALLWIIRAKCLVNSGCEPGVELPFRFPINLRGRELPTLTQGYMGNAGLLCNVHATVHELCESSLADVVQKIRSSMVDIHKHLQSDIDYIELQLQNGHIPCIDRSFFGIPSLVNLPFYDTDCGWGLPIYCARPSRQLSYRIIILDDPRSKCWNVLVVLNSQEEYNIFQEEITKCIMIA